jgi:hypothetical protein
MRRRDAIVRTYLPAINPIVDVRLTDEAGLTFDNAAVAAGVATAPAAYEAEWLRFVNETGATSALGVTRSASTAMTPPALPTEAGAFVQVNLRAVDGPHASWREPLRTWFRRDAAGWVLVGLERLP